jgi:hypothetical protein
MRPGIQLPGFRALITEQRVSIKNSPSATFCFSGAATESTDTHAPANIGNVLNSISHD